MTKILMLLISLCWLPMVTAAPFQTENEPNYSLLSSNVEKSQERPWKATTSLLNSCRDCALLKWALASAPQTLAVDIAVSPKSYFVNGSSLGHFHILIQLNEWDLNSDQRLDLALQPFISSSPAQQPSLTLAAVTR